MRSSITAVLVLGSLVEIVSWHLHQRVPNMAPNLPCQRHSLLMKWDMRSVDTSCCFVTGISNSGNRGHRQYHETLHKMNPFETYIEEGFVANGLMPGFQLFTQFIIEGSKTLLNGSRLVSRLHLENVLLKLIIIFFIHSLILKRNYSLELQLLAMAIFHWEVSRATLTPTPTYSRGFSAHRATPSLSSFQSTITNDHLTRTLSNSSITVSQGTTASSRTANFQIDVPVTDTKLAHLQGVCDEDWIHEGDLCYKVVTETKVFNYAERFCVIHSAHLISITSKEENDIIFNLVETSIGQTGKRRIWLGMERLSSDSKLHWVDKKPLNYENWAPGEPDQTGACVQMIHKGWWEDTSCTQQLPYICKKGSKTSLPYSRATELGILIGIPMACSAIMLTVVAVLFVKSVHDSEGTYYGYGKHRNKDKIHSCLVRMTTSIAHVGAVGYVNKGRHFSRSSIRSIPSVQSLPGAHSSEHSQPNSPVEAPEITITPGTPEADRRLDIAKVLASSNASIEQDRFQSVTSLENLLSKRYIKPKTRKLRSLKKPDAVVTPAGAAGKYIKKDERFEFYEA